MSPAWKRLRSENPQECSNPWEAPITGRCYEYHERLAQSLDGGAHLMLIGGAVFKFGLQQALLRDARIEVHDIDYSEQHSTFLRLAQCLRPGTNFCDGTQRIHRTPP
jgi:hypothetical protein